MPTSHLQVTWLLCDILTGRVLTELPLSAGDSIKHLIARVETGNFTLAPLDRNTPDDWAALLVDGKTMIVLDLDGVPTQGWTVDEHETGDVTIPITASTLETCLARTNVPDLDPYGLDYSDVALALTADLVPRFGFDLNAVLTGKVFTADQTYSSLEDRAVLAALNEDIMAAEGGPEWRIELAYADNTRRVITKTVDIRPKIGVDRPDAIFDLDTDGRGVVDTYRRRTSYAAGKGATMLIGTSEGSGDSRPMTDPILSDRILAGWPVWEERKNYTGLGAGDVDEDTELLQNAKVTAAARERGAVTWTITGSDLAPKPGVGYASGDTVHVAIAPQGKLDPIGGTATVRVLGWELNLASQRATLIAWDDDSDADG